MEKAKALAHFGSNVSKLTDGLSKCKDLPASAKQAAEDFKDIVTKFPDLKNNADVIGKKAFTENHVILEEVT